MSAVERSLFQACCLVPVTRDRGHAWLPEEGADAWVINGGFGKNGSQFLNLVRDKNLSEGWGKV